MSGKHEAGKGDTYRKVDYAQWSRNWDAIFKKKKKRNKKIASKEK